MAFESFADFLAMGKHGVYVWSCYGLTFGVIAWLLWQTLNERKQFFVEQQQQMKRDAAQAARNKDES
jgi:heme exporter protein D